MRVLAILFLVITLIFVVIGITLSVSGTHDSIYTLSNGQKLVIHSSNSGTAELDGELIVPLVVDDNRTISIMFIVCGLVFVLLSLLCANNS